jgi:hypothetical protein
MVEFHSSDQPMEQPKPLKSMEFKRIQDPLTGLLRNIDMELQRKIKAADAIQDREENRRLTLLLTMLRFAVNSYEAISFLLTDVEEHPKRLRRFVLVVPAVSRQIMDLWFSLVYMMDDFGPRSLLYEQGGYRELRKQIDDNRSRYGADNPEWQDWYEEMDELAKMVEVQLSLSPEQISDPKSTIPSWPYPHALTQKESNCQTFLQLLDGLLYEEASVYAHLKPSGLMVSAATLLADIAPDHIREQIEERHIHQFKFRHYCRVVMTLLGIASEIDVYCNLGNQEQARLVWERLAENNFDARDVYTARYQELLGGTLSSC